MLLKEAFDFLPKSKIKAGEGSDKGKYPFFTSSDIKIKRIDNYLFDDELVILGTGGMPSCNYYNGKFAASTDNFVLKSKGLIKPKYLYYFLRKGNLTVLAAGFRGTGLKHISKEYVGNIDVINTSLENQEKIIKIGDTLNSLIGECEQELSLLNELIKSRFNEMFSSYKAEKTINDIASIYRGASPRPISKFITKGDGENWIKIGDVAENDIYITRTSEKVTKEGADKSRRVKPGDFILSNSMSFGRPYILGIYGCVHDGWLIISNYEQTFEPLFFYYLLRTNEVQAQFDGSASGSCVRNLNSDLVRRVVVMTPPLTKQREFVDFESKVDKLKFNVQKRIETYKELLNKKMDEYFN